MARIEEIVTFQGVQVAATDDGVFIQDDEVWEPIVFGIDISGPRPLFDFTGLRLPAERAEGER